MPDVVERCPMCGATPIDTSPGFSAWECGTVRSDGEVYDGPDCLRRQLAAARSEAERWRARYEALRAGGGGAVVVLTHDDCNTLMHGLRSREELEDYLLPEALEHYERLATHIIDVGVGWSGGAEDA